MCVYRRSARNVKAVCRNDVKRLKKYAKKTRNYEVNLIEGFIQIIKRQFLALLNIGPKITINITRTEHINNPTMEFR